MTSVLAKNLNTNKKNFLIASRIQAKDIIKILREGFEFDLLNDGFLDLIDTLDLDYLEMEKVAKKICNREPEKSFGLKGKG